MTRLECSYKLRIKALATWVTGQSLAKEHFVQFQLVEQDCRTCERVNRHLVVNHNLMEMSCYF